jgi:DNA repair exonuclease SbcCD ATPase subunit
MGSRERKSISLLRGLLSEYESHVRERSRLEKERERLISERDRISKERENHDNILYTIKLLFERVTDRSKARLENYLTHAMKSVFSDRDYSVKLNVRDDTKRPAIEIMLVEDGVEQEITDAVGGGITSVLGLLLQIYYIEAFNVNRILIIDEGLKEVSSSKRGSDTDSVSYLDNLLVFLKWLAHEKGYKIVVVTHDDKVSDYADKVYHIIRGEVFE